MASYTCKHCDRTMKDEENMLVEKVHTHMHENHGKHLSERKIRKQLKDLD